MGNHFLFQLGARWRFPSFLLYGPQALQRQGLGFAPFECQILRVGDIGENDLTGTLIAPARGMDYKFMLLLRRILAAPVGCATKSICGITPCLTQVDLPALIVDSFSHDPQIEYFQNRFHQKSLWDSELSAHCFFDARIWNEPDKCHHYVKSE